MEPRSSDACLNGRLGGSGQGRTFILAEEEKTQRIQQNYNKMHRDQQFLKKERNQFEAQESSTCRALLPDAPPPVPLGQLQGHQLEATLYRCFAPLIPEHHWVVDPFSHVGSFLLKPNPETTLPHLLSQFLESLPLLEPDISKSLQELLY